MVDHKSDYFKLFANKKDTVKVQGIQYITSCIMNQNTIAGGSRGNAGNSSHSADFDGQHTYVIQDSRRESQDEELEGAGTENFLLLAALALKNSSKIIVCKPRSTNTQKSIVFRC